MKNVLKSASWRSFCYFLNINFALLICLSGCGSRTEVETVAAAKHDVESTITTVNAGTVKAEQTAELAFGTVGRVSLLNVKLGDEVKAGDILAEVENVDLKHSLVRTETEFKRKTSSGAGAVSRSELDITAQEVAAAKAALEKSYIRAPYDGMISELNLEVGQLSQITAIITKPQIRIVDRAPRYIRAEIDEVDLPKVKVGQEARVKILAVRKEPFKGVVRKVIPYVSTIREQDRTCEIEVDLNAENQILPAGASADIEIITERKANVLALPSRAVMGRGEARYVFLVSGNKAKKQNVGVGLYNYDYTEILSGIEPESSVVLPGESFDLKDGDRLTIKAK